MDISQLTIQSAAHHMAAGDISAVELTQAVIERIHHLDPTLKAFITFMPDAALQSAREADEARARGEHRGPLHGIPLALKDLIDVAGLPTTAGSMIGAGSIAEADATVTARLKVAGAVLLGKLNMHEWAMGTTTDNPFFGTCRNPWDIARTPSGSSGGSAVALAASLCLGALGSDTRGSIRTPASLCGIIGFKPSYGRVSLHGVVPVSWTLDHVGPMGRCVGDVALMMNALAGYDPLDPYSSETAVPDFTAGLADGVAGWRIAVAEDAYFSQMAPAVGAAMQQVQAVLRDLGAIIEPLDLAFLGQPATDASKVIMGAEAAAYHADKLHTQPDAFSSDILARLRRGQALSGAEVALARHEQARLRRRFDELMAPYDLLITAATPVTAPRRDDLDELAFAGANLSNFSGPFNLLGVPALSMPAGFDESGLPIGLQIVGRWADDAWVLRGASAYERATDWHMRRPVVG